MNRGKLCLYTSSVIYGLIPVLAKTAYSGGANGLTLSFLRASLCVPLLFFAAARRGTLKVSGEALKRIVLLGTFGSAMSITLLYISYNYIPAGLATTLHFVYPILIFTAEFFICKKKISRRETVSLILAAAGIALFADINGSGDIAGVVTALLSGAFYAFYVMYLEKSGLEKTDCIALTFYVCLITSAVVFVYGMFSGTLTFSLTPYAWTCAFIISLASSLLAIPLFQIGLEYTDPRTASVISTAEPITGVAAGALFLGEGISAVKAAGCALILLGVLAAGAKK